MSAQAAVALDMIETPQLEPALKPCEVKRQALVVDDNPDITRMLAVALRDVGYEVATANSASSALEAALTNRYDIIISDIGMPGMTGYELARALRSVPRYSTTQIVSMTGFDMYDNRDRALEAGFNAHLRKPLDWLSLSQVVPGM